MFKHRLRGFSKSFGNQIDPVKSEQLKRTKTDVETSLTRIVKLIKNEEGKSRKEKELVGLIEDFYNQYQSLYTLYGRLTGEYVKAAPCVMERQSSSSESDYFSSEEVLDADNSDISDSNQKPFFREREPSTSILPNNKTLQLVLMTKSTNELEDKLKRNLEIQLEKQLSAKNSEFHNQVLELQLLLKDSKETVSVLQAKLKTNEDEATSKIAQLMARINKVEQEAKSLRMHKGKLEEKIRRKKNKALSQKKDFTDQINVMQRKLDLLSNHNKELEGKLEREREQVSESLVQIENLQKSLAENESVEMNLLKEKESFLARIKDLELEVESRNHELERAMAHREEERSELLREHGSCKEGASVHAEALKAGVEKLGMELDQKSMLELQNEQNQREYSESLVKMENLKAELEARVADQKETIEKLMERIEQIERVGSYEDELRVRGTRGLEVNNLNGLELGAGKLEEQREPVLGEVELANDWIRERKGEMKEKVDKLTALVGKKEEEMLLLRGKVWKLEAKVSKEAGEKLNLVRGLRQLERKVGKLERKLKEKEEELLGLGEKKREAIRQLCFLSEFHRNRYVYLMDLVSNRRVGKRK
ncbi:hypothetical protein VNO78_07681 [Psophocarpus tetragonolobus]|uniref:NAB domain-containing protein n=1 Tax=Psophocarpus tetragonolobus TaxID=3891 RepID=A0AAN9SUM4_PSOTE